MDDIPTTDPAVFVVANTRLLPVPLVPEIVLHLADEAVPLWTRTEDELERTGLPPPFWAFAWAGGQALARYVLDNPHVVAGRDVIDIASGSGLVAIAAMKAGARSVLAADIDRFAHAAIGVNARANDVSLTCAKDNLLDDDAPPTAEVLLAGDIFYERDTATAVLAFLEDHAARGAIVLIGDPGRSYLPKDRLHELASYSVPVTRDLEDMDIKYTTVWELKARGH